MESLTQKKFSISTEQKEFLEKYKEWGFSDQSSFVRVALDRLITEFKTKKRKDLMAKKAKDLLSAYSENKELTIFTELDGEDFL